VHITVWIILITIVLPIPTYTELLITKVIDYKRIQKRRETREIREHRYDGTSLLDSIESNGASFNPEAQLLHNEKIAEVRHAMQSLPAKFQHPAALFYISDLAVAEISEVMNISPGTVKSRLYRARKRLEVLLKDMQEHYDEVSGEGSTRR